MTGLSTSGIEREPPRRCRACDKHIEPPEIPQDITVPSGDTIQCCPDCAMSIMCGDWSTLPEASQL